METIGPDHIPMAFRTARRADRNAALLCNDYGAEGFGATSDGICSLLSNLLADGTPIDAVGLQCHLDAIDAPGVDALTENMARSASLGLGVAVTELDVNLYGTQGSVEEKLALQAQVHRNVLTAGLAVGGNFWGLTQWRLDDADSWLFDFGVPTEAPVMFDAELQPKPAHDALAEVLAG